MSSSVVTDPADGETLSSNSIMRRLVQEGLAEEGEIGVGIVDRFQSRPTSRVDELFAKRQVVVPGSTFQAIYAVSPQGNLDTISVPTKLVELEVTKDCDFECILQQLRILGPSLEHQLCGDLSPHVHNGKTVAPPEHLAKTPIAVSPLDLLSRVTTFSPVYA
jgi:hypothetical protein